MTAFEGMRNVHCFNGSVCSWKAARHSRSSRQKFRYARLVTAQPTVTSSAGSTRYPGLMKPPSWQTAISVSIGPLWRFCGLWIPTRVRRSPDGMFFQTAAAGCSIAQTVRMSGFSGGRCGRWWVIFLSVCHAVITEFYTNFEPPGTAWSILHSQSELSICIPGSDPNTQRSSRACTCRRLTTTSGRTICCRSRRLSGGICAIRPQEFGGESIRGLSKAHFP